MMIRAGIVGISGFGGKVLMDILLNHRDARITYVAANSTVGRVDDIWPVFRGRTDLVCAKYDQAQAVELCDVVFLALPHMESMKVVGPLLKAGKKVIDLSADYRLKKASLYKTWYNAEHTDRRNLAKAVYGLPEIFRARISKSGFIANPGCYPTAALLGLAPLVSVHGDKVASIIIDAKSGTSGAGRKVAEGFMFCFVNENFKAYRVLNHQHTPEISQFLGKMAGRDLPVVFVPHLLPINNGILETIYVTLKEKMSEAKLDDLYRKFYKTEPFVRVSPKGAQVEIRNVVDTNFCDIALTLSPDRKLLVITSVIDNLVKGAAGQAVHNMNIMYGIDEREGLL
ncbi:MAG: N-acetyl-gamma-glutamyl-phosphate reductase [Candidatus Omnitrophica bacterium]|nr:N-acetyl-gamma-glutamyl-phosphate reductase [Candidatus Omnitrophota bacterium]